MSKCILRRQVVNYVKMTKCRASTLAAVSIWLYLYRTGSFIYITTRKAAQVDQF
jgi:hypothetical protein